MPERINKVIELLASGQPVYYTGPSSRGYEGGQKDAQTWADYINYDFEHGPFDMTVLREQYAGPGGRRADQEWPPHPGRGGHPPRDRTSEATVRATPGRSPTSSPAGCTGSCSPRRRSRRRAFVESPLGLPDPRRGRGPAGRGPDGQRRAGYAARIWGLEPRGVHAQGRPLAPQSPGAVPGAQDREQAGPGQHRRVPRRPGDRLRRVGPRGHGALPWLRRPPRPALPAGDAAREPASWPAARPTTSPSSTRPGHRTWWT